MALTFDLFDSPNFWLAESAESDCILDLQKLSRPGMGNSDVTASQLGKRQHSHGKSQP